MAVNCLKLLNLKFLFIPTLDSGKDFVHKIQLAQVLQKVPFKVKIFFSIDNFLLNFSYFSNPFQKANFYLKSVHTFL